MKRFAAVFLSLLLFIPAASADPLPLAEEDLTDTITVFYNGEDDSDGRYVWSCRYPVIADENDLSAVCINEYYRKKVQEYNAFYAPSQAQAYADQYQNVTIGVSYEVTCNNDDCFSVLLHKTEDVEGEVSEIWEGNTFSRKSEMIGSVTSLPTLLGLVDDGESDEWLGNRQSVKVCEVLRSLVWDAVLENPEGIDYLPDLKEEDLESIIDPDISPDQDYYINEDGDVVFFVLPGRVAPPDAGLITFTFTMEELQDEL